MNNLYKGLALFFGFITFLMGFYSVTTCVLGFISLIDPDVKIIDTWSIWAAIPATYLCLFFLAITNRICKDYNL